MRGYTAVDGVDELPRPGLCHPRLTGIIKEEGRLHAGLVAVIEIDAASHLLINRIFGNTRHKAVVAGFAEGAVEFGGEGVISAMQFDQSRYVVGHPPGILGGVAFVPSVFVLQDIEGLSPVARTVAYPHPADLVIEDVPVVFGSFGEQVIVILFAQLSGHLGQGEILIGVFEGEGRPVLMESVLDRVQRPGDISQLHVFLDAAALEGGVFVSGLAHHASGHMVLAHALIGLGDIEPSDAFHVGAGDEGGGGGTGHDIGVISAGWSTGDKAAVIVHQEHGVDEFFGHLWIYQVP